MPPPKRAKIVRDVGSKDYGAIDYGSPDDFNRPPDTFDAFMVCIFGQKGVGKSTLASQFEGNFTWMFEPRRRNLSIWQRNLQKYSAEQIMAGAPDTWQMLKNTSSKILNDKNVKRITYDSVDIAYECCYHSVCALNKVTKPSESKNGSDIWNQVRDEWAAYFDEVAASSKGITLLSHLKIREDTDLENVKTERRQPSCSPACLKYIKQAVDFVFFYGKIDGRRAMQIRDIDGSAEVAVGAEGRFMQPDGKPITYLEMPELTDKVTGYQRLIEGFENKCWDFYTEEEDRKVITKSKGVSKPTTKPGLKKGPPKR